MIPAPPPLPPIYDHRHSLEPKWIQTLLWHPYDPRLLHGDYMTPVCPGAGMIPWEKDHHVAQVAEGNHNRLGVCASCWNEKHHQRMWLKVKGTASTSIHRRKMEQDAVTTQLAPGHDYKACNPTESVLFYQLLLQVNTTSVLGMRLVNCCFIKHAQGKVQVNRIAKCEYH